MRNLCKVYHNLDKGCAISSLAKKRDRSYYIDSMKEARGSSTIINSSAYS
jgi:hypothetical protein